MKLNLGSALTLLSAILGGGASTHQQVILIQDTERFVLPITPETFSINNGQENKTVNITSLGEAMIFGMPKLKTLSLASFFPNPDREYPFVVGDTKTPSECIALIEKWKESRRPIRVIITNSPINMMMGIQSLEYKKQDGSGDYYYTISLLEYRDLNTQSANNDKQVEEETGLKQRSSTDMKPNTATLYKEGSDLLDASKKAYGQYSKWRRIAKSNNLTDLAINNASKWRKLKV